MKVLASALAAITLLSCGIAEAQYYPPRRGGYDRPRRDYPRHPRRYPRRDTVVVGAACAPEVLEGNVKATDRTLAGLAKSEQFAQATTFQSEVARIAKIQDAAEKSAAYFDLVGVDATDSKQVVEFIGAREVSGAQLVELQRNADLSAEQANTVASKLQATLKGGLQ